MFLHHILVYYSPTVETRAGQEVRPWSLSLYFRLYVGPSVQTLFSRLIFITVWKIVSKMILLRFINSWLPLYRNLSRGTCTVSKLRKYVFVWYHFSSSDFKLAQMTKAHSNDIFSGLMKYLCQVLASKRFPLQI